MANTALEPIRIASSPTFAAYVRFMLWSTFRQTRALAPFAVLSLLCFLFAPLLPLVAEGAAARYRASLGLLILPALLWVLLPLSSYLTARSRWQSAADIKAPRTYTFTDAGVEIAGDSFHSQFAWEHVTIALRHRDQILLGTAQRQFYLVPVNDFESEVQLERFVELVKRNVPKCQL